MNAAETDALRQSREALNAVIQKSRRIVFFGGAGVSTASGLPLPGRAICRRI